MKLTIKSVHNHGDAKKEYVLMQAVEDCDVGRYVLADSTYTDENTVSNKLRHTFWFPDKMIKKGDLVSLWTGIGEDITTKTDSGTPLHRFYWNLGVPVWNDDGDAAVLLEVRTYQLFKVKG